MVESVERSYGRCILSPGFFDDFYDDFFSRSDEIRNKFKNTDMSKQKSLLRHGISYMIMFAGGQKTANTMMDKLAVSHSPENMDIEPWMYTEWADALLKTVRKHDKKMDPTVLSTWRHVLQNGIRKISSGAGQLQRS